MRTTILFGGTNKERLVSVASAQALCEALPDADLWFWDADDSVHQTHAKTLLEHARPFELATFLIDYHQILRLKHPFVHAGWGGQDAGVGEAHR